MGFRTSGSGATERHVVSDIRAGSPTVTRRGSTPASGTTAGARNIGVAEVVSVDAAGRRLTVVDSTGTTRVLDVRGSALTNLRGLNPGDQISLGVAAPLVSGTPAGTVTSIGSATAGTNTPRETANASGRMGETSGNVRTGTPARTSATNTNSRNTAGGTTGANTAPSGNVVGRADGQTAPNATSGTNTATGARTNNPIGTNNATGTNNTTGANRPTATNNTTTNQGTVNNQAGTLSFQPRPGDTAPPTAGPQSRTDRNRGETATNPTNTPNNTPTFNNGSLPNAPALPAAPPSGLSTNPAQAGVQPVPQAQPVPGVQGPTGVQPVPGAQPLPGTGVTGQGAANPGLSPQPVPGAGGQTANNAGATGGTATTRSTGVSTGGATTAAGGGAGSANAAGGGTGSPIVGGTGTAVGGTTNAVPQLSGVSQTGINSQIPSVPQAPGTGTTAVLPIPSVTPETNPPQTPEQVAMVRELGSRDFDLAVATLGARAAEVDRAWFAYRSGCITTTVALNNRAREWFGLLDGSIIKPTDDTCEQSFAEVERLAHSVSAGLDTARDAARRADVLPGRMREILQRYNLDI